MDPTATWAELSTLASDTLSGREPDPDRMSELITALNQWAARGGHPPAQWTP
ncbi:hypothetical protein [Actinokineospora terrae]|uniref:Uncharacterized protein n=1 Tax=Actinokineospora terrae TaxID=155974 RepID=A0A1H9XTR5_9PSEU|nr:hypothetical protein [Actinokineospora terrae]SES49107.1 hypothetical protein SAMN04487818_12428 [Actinokineospora terrae]